MSEFRLVQTAERSPTTCLACSTHVGPFIDLMTTIAQVPTQVGVMDMDVGFYLCVGTVETPGCIVQMARKTGLMVELPLYTDAVDGLTQANEMIAKLNADLIELAKKKTVPATQIFELMNTAGTATTSNVTYNTFPSTGSSAR